MEMQPDDRIEERASGETPEDVAILYSWANLEGAKYRDFSANRREYRAQMRHRAAEQLRLVELRAQSEAEAAAAEAEAESAAAHAEAAAASMKLAASRVMQISSSSKTVGEPEDLEAEEQVEHMRRSSLREAEQQTRRAAAERLEAARRAEAATLADSIARREEREIAEAQASAVRQAAQYAESDARHRQKRAMQPDNLVPGRISDPYGPQVVAEGEYFERPGTPVSELEAIRFRQQREYIEENTGVKLPPFHVSESFSERAPRGRQALSYAESFERFRGQTPDPLLGRTPAATDESLLNGAQRFDDAPSHLEPHHQSKPVYDERSLLIARDAHRLDEADVLQLRRERERNFEPHDDNADSLGRVAAPSIPYKQFRRTANGAAPTSAPEVVSHLRGSRLEESDWHVDESLIGSGHSQLKGIEARDRDPQRRSDAAGERWIAPLQLPAAEPHSARPSMKNGSGRPAWQEFGAPVEPRFRPVDGGASLQAQENGNGNEIGHETATIPSLQFRRDSWVVASEQPKPDPRVARIAERQPIWSSRPESAKPLPPDDVPVAKEPMDSPGPAFLYQKTQGPRFVDSLATSGSRAVAQLAVESLKAGSGQTESGTTREAAAAVQVRGPVENNLKHPREQVASRWFALKSVFAQTDRDEKDEEQPVRGRKPATPFVVVYSMAGGVGKTSLVATLGRALSSLGDKVLLTDTTSQGLLPFYFGASELHPGVLRKFSPPSGSPDAPIQLVSYNFAGVNRETLRGAGEAHGDVFEELVGNSDAADWVLLDLNGNSSWIVAKMAWMRPRVLVPLAADMNSVISLHAVERSFHAMQDAEGKPLQPMYLLNQFDASMPLHLEVYEVLKHHLGERLLPFNIRRASSVGEALAEGMTVVDYDRQSEVVQDYMEVANWLRTASAPATVGFRNLRWSER